MLKPALILLAGLAITSCDRALPSADAPTAPTAGAAQADPAAAVTPPPQQQTTIPTHVTQQAPLLQSTPTREKPRQATLYTPPPGSAERVALMNALRAQVRGDLGTEPVFVVKELRSNGEWAFAKLEPTLRDGRPIDIERTPIYREHGPDALDGLRTEAIWRKERGRWQVHAHAIGATDVWWTEYCGTVPRTVMGPPC